MAQKYNYVDRGKKKSSSCSSILASDKCPVFSLPSLSPVYYTCELDERTPITKRPLGRPPGCSAGRPSAGGAHHSRHQYPVGRKEGRRMRDIVAGSRRAREVFLFLAGGFYGGGAVRRISWA